jgi:8-oxo-dGTP pyrophosphatase MutT (NUDIX family)
VLWRPASGGGVELCLIATRGGTRWQLPKGHASQGESEADAARREVREETGCDGEVGEDLGEITFWFFAGGGATRKRVKKVVHFFLLRYLRGETRDHDAEVDDARWFPGAEAAQRLTFDSERKIAELGLARLGQGQRASST